jgi:hypothetical protein
MSIVNLGSAAVEAILNLRTSSDFAQIKTGLTEQMGKFMNAAVELGTPDSAGYARAIRDLVIFIDLAETGPTGARKPKPTPSLEHARRFNG